MTERLTSRPWIPNKPEQRFQIALTRLLDDVLIQPAYFTFNHDADGGARTDLQRMRDVNRGIKSGQLDGEVEQGPPHLFRRIELKRGKNTPTERQKQTIAACTACGAPPVVAWTLADAVAGLSAAGFRFAPTLPVRLAWWEAQLEAWDREAEAKLAGVATKPKRAPRKVAPGRVAGKRFTAKFYKMMGSAT